MKEHQFFRDIDWQQVYMQKYTPPLTPPRGEVNAADAFDIGSFDEEDTKGYKVHPSWISNFFKVVLVSSNLSLSLSLSYPPLHPEYSSVFQKKSRMIHSFLITK